MDFGVLVRKNYATKSQEICWVSRIYNKECIKELLVNWTSSKVVFVHNAHGHVVKCRLVLVQDDTWPCWLKLWFITSTYQERLLSGVMKRKRSRLVSKAIFYFNKVCSCKILTCIRREVLPPWPRDSLP